MNEICHFSDAMNLFIAVFLAALPQIILQRTGIIKVVFQWFFIPARDKDDIFDASSDQFFHHNLDNWLVDNR